MVSNVDPTVPADFDPTGRAKHGDKQEFRDNFQTIKDEIEALQAQTGDTEAVNDLVGAMFTGNTESGIVSTHNDPLDKIDLQVQNLTTAFFTSPNISQWTNDAGYISATLTQEEVEDFAGALFTGNVESGITSTYNDGTGKVDLSVPTPVTDHGTLTGLSDDDHAQYLLLAGRAGGQSFFGGTLTGQDLTIAANAADLTGVINMNSPIIFGPYAASGALYGFTYNPVESFTAAFIGGGLNFSGQVTFSHPTFIYESFRGAPTITSATNLGFAAYTVLQALPLFNAGSVSTHNPLAPLVLNCGPTVSNSFIGARTTSTMQIINGGMQVRASGTLSTMNVTTYTGLRFAPTFSTGTASSVVNFGNITALVCSNPVTALFQPNNGTETLSSYIGVDFQNITLGGNVTKVALRSAQAPATNSYFLQNTGGAQSDFGGSFIVDVGLLQILSDSLGLSLGAAGGDMQILWDGADLKFDPLIGDNLFFNFSSPAGRDTYIWRANDFAVSETNYTELRFAFDRFAFGQTGSIGNQVGVFIAPNRTVALAGGWADFLLTQAGNLDINGLAMSDVSAWAINAISLDALGGGSIGDVATLRIGGMTTTNLGAADTAALYYTGRRTARGVDAFDPLTPTTLTGDVDDYAPATGTAMRQVWRVATDNLGNRTITGVAVQQSVDTQWLTNVSATDSIILSHQDAGSAAGNRIISPTGANLTLAPDESALLWHDDTTDRWRILFHTGT